MKSNKTRTHLASSLILFLAVFSTLIPYVYGTVWSPKTRVTWDSSIDWSPSIAQANDGRIWFVWHSYALGENPDILYKVYNGSATFPWSPTKKLTTDTNKDQNPSITNTTGGDLWFVWSSNRDGNFEIYYKTYNGSWSPDTRLTNNTNKDESPSVMQDSNGSIWVFWSSNRTGDYNIFCRKYIGYWWPEEPIFIESDNPADDLDPTIIEATDGYIWLVWVRDDNLFYKTFPKNFGPGGIPDTPITSDSELNSHPSIMQAQGDIIWVAYTSNKSVPGKQDIYVATHTPGSPPGAWGEERITFDENFDVAPTIMQADDGTIWIAWTSDRLEGNWDIYYITDDPPQHDHDVAIMCVTHNFPATYLAKGSTISIEVVPQNQGLMPEICDVQVRANSTLIGQKNYSLMPGQLKPLYFQWNTSNVAYGVYTMNATVAIVTGETDTADNTHIYGTVLLTIPGDVNGDRIVDIFDIGTLSAHWYPGPPIGSLGYDANCDVNHDGAVDIFDIGLASAHLGESW